MAYIGVMNSGTPNRFTTRGKAEMTARDIAIGTKFFFGYRRTPNTVIRVIPMQNHSQYVAQVYLRGPRGGEFIAYVREDGSCRKI